MIDAPAAAHTAIAFGCRWASEFPLPLFQQAESPRGPAEVQVRLGKAPAKPRPFDYSNGRLRFCPDGLRYLVDDNTVLDLYEDSRIKATPGAEWRGTPPAAFYGTVTAALLAARGHLPIHGSSVAIGDRAVLLCGHSGAGKSTLTAALLAAGGKLLSDDLSALQVSSQDDSVVLFAGRRSVRLFPDVAAMLQTQVSAEMMPLEHEKKVLALPPVADATVAYPLAAVLMLAADPALVSKPGASALLLMEYTYRRRAFQHLPRQNRRVEMAGIVAAAVPVLAFPRVEAREATSLHRIAEMALQRCHPHLG